MELGSFISNIFRKKNKDSGKAPNPESMFNKAKKQFAKDPFRKPSKFHTSETYLARKEIERVIVPNNDDTQNNDSPMNDMLSNDVLKNMKGQYRQHLSILKTTIVELVREVSMDHGNVVPEINLREENGWLRALVNYSFGHSLSPQDLSRLYKNLQAFKNNLTPFNAKVELIHNLCATDRPKDQVAFMVYLPEQLKGKRSTQRASQSLDQ